MIVAGMIASSYAGGAERFMGLAYAHGTDKLLYREVHWRFTEGGVAQRLVLYECAQGAPFARKLVRNSPSDTAPDFDFEDGRDGYREGVRTNGGLREVYVQQSPHAPLESRPLPSVPDGVIDAGFDAYVRGHWVELSRPSTRRIPLLVPNRFEFMEFSLSPPQEETLAEHRVTRLRLRLDTWYAFAAPSIEFVYEPDGTRLIEFEGPATVRSTDGRNAPVRLIFPASGHFAEVPDAEVHLARAAPLSATCNAAHG
jgi:hypothetical protein